MKEKVGWGRTKNTGLNEASCSQGTAAAGQVCNFFRMCEGFMSKVKPASPADGFWLRSLKGYCRLALWCIAVVRATFGCFLKASQLF
jgi:hypothetical protein